MIKINGAKLYTNQHFKDGGLRVRNNLHAPDRKVQIYDLPSGIGSAFYRITVGENALWLAVRVAEKRDSRLISEVLHKEGAPEEISTLFVDVLKRIKKP
jgi:hypothetical protein